MKLKAGVRLINTKPQVILAAVIAGEIWKELGQELVITSGSEGSHSQYSAHYRGDALDFRTRYFSDEQIASGARNLTDKLGKDFLVLIEKTHIHLQWRPGRL